MAEGLKPCPFCGRMDKLKVWNFMQCVGDVKIENWRVSCNAEGDNTGCGGSGGTKRTRKEAIEEWNRRADDDQG